MDDQEQKEKHAQINPAARRDVPGEPHQDLVESGRKHQGPQVKPYQAEPLDPRDPGGIAE